MKVLIIGGTGTIGSAISKGALRKGHDVFVLSRHIKPSGNEKLKVIKCDWNDVSQVQRVVEQKFDVILDGLVFDENRLARDMELCDEKCRHFIYISTDSVYNRPAIEISENASIDLDKLKWDISKGKRMAEIYLEKHSREYGFMTTTIRPVITYGINRIPLGFVGRANQWTLIDRIKKGKPLVFMSDEGSIHSICHEELFADCIESLFLKEKADMQVYHFANDETYTFDEIAECLGEIVGVKPKIVHYPAEALKPYDKVLYEEEVYDKIPSFTVNNNKIKSLSPWIETKVSLRDTLNSAFRYLEKEQSNRPLDDHFNVICDDLLLNFKKYNLAESEIKVAEEYVKECRPQEKRVVHEKAGKMKRKEIARRIYVPIIRWGRTKIKNDTYKR